MQMEKKSFITSYDRKNISVATAGISQLQLHLQLKKYLEKILVISEVTTGKNITITTTLATANSVATTLTTKKILQLHIQLEKILITTLATGKNISVATPHATGENYDNRTYN